MSNPAVVVERLEQSPLGAGMAQVRRLCVGPGSSFSAEAGAFQRVGLQRTERREGAEVGVGAAVLFAVSQPKAAPRVVQTNTLSRGAEPEALDEDTCVGVSENRPDEMEK